MLSWVSFWINHEATSARVALGNRQKHMSRGIKLKMKCCLGVNAPNMRHHCKMMLWNFLRRCERIKNTLISLFFHQCGLSPFHSDTFFCRYYNGADDDYYKYRSTVVIATNLLRQSYRHLPGDVLCFCVRGTAGIRRRQLYLLGCSSQAESETHERSEEEWSRNWLPGNGTKQEIKWAISFVEVLHNSDDKVFIFSMPIPCMQT